MSKKESVVLLVEDNPAEQNLAKRSFKKCTVEANLQIVSDGEEALEYLFRRGRYADPSSSPRPDIILLDLNLPKVEGREVLKTIKEFKPLANIPVIVLTTSRKPEDVVRSYELGCSSFLNKPVDITEFINVLKEVGSYWLELVVLPTKKQP